MRIDDLPAMKEPCILVEVLATWGSAPREADAFMLVTGNEIIGTIGGGPMEFNAVAAARQMLRRGERTGGLEIVLGPDSGQCCGGRVKLGLSVFDEQSRLVLQSKITRQASGFQDVFVFGAGHVGRALVRALEPLPFHITVVETREEELSLLPKGTRHRLVAMPEQEIGSIRAGGAVVIVTHDHALDFLIASEALQRDDLAYVGMIGSKTKRAVFSSWLRKTDMNDRLLDRLVLPIGGSAIRDKRPEVIAALVSAELLTVLLGAPAQHC